MPHRNHSVSSPLSQNPIHRRKSPYSLAHGVDRSGCVQWATSDLQVEQRDLSRRQTDKQVLPPRVSSRDLKSVFDSTELRADLTASSRQKSKSRIDWLQGGRDEACIATNVYRHGRSRQIKSSSTLDGHRPTDRHCRFLWSPRWVLQA